MKKLLAGTVLALLCSNAYAADEGFFFKPYIGADYQYRTYGNQTDGFGNRTSDYMETDLNGVDLHAGARIHKYLGLEVSYFQTAEGEKSDVLGTAFDTKVDVTGGAFDVMGYLPAGNGVELIGTAGLAYSKAELDAPGALKADESEWKPRIGGGAQYWFTDSLNARFLARYQGADFRDTVDGAVIVNAGVNWQF